MKFIDKHKPWFILGCLAISFGLSRFIDITNIQIVASPIINTVLGIVSIACMALLVYLGYVAAGKIR